MVEPEPGAPASGLRFWAVRSYPLLLAAFPVVRSASRNPGYYDPTRAVLLCGIAVAALILVAGIAYVALRRRFARAAAADGAAFVALGALTVFYSVVIVDKARPLFEARPLAAAGAAAVGAVAVAAALTWAYRRGWHRHAALRRLPALGDVSRFLSLASLLLVGSSAARIAYDRVVAARALGRSALVRELQRPVPTRGAATAAATTRAGPKRDIYILLLDEYASPDVFRERYGIDTRPFIDSLRAIGFHVPTSVRSNYANTLLSVGSLLNFAHVRPLADVMRPDARDFTPATYLLEHHRAARFLKGHGYRFVFFPSSWYYPTQGNESADAQFDPYTGFDLARALYQSPFTGSLAAATLLRLVTPHLRSSHAVSLDHALRTFAGVASLPGRPASERRQPTFAVAHVLMPHVPAIADSACRVRTTGPASRAPAVTRRPRGPKALMAGQLGCVNAQTLRLARALIARSEVPPIIIVQGDHGTQTLRPFAPGAGPFTTAQARERFRTFGAYYLPGGGAAAVPDSISVVNVLRYVFGYYFDADLPPLPDAMYFSHWRSPYGMAPVDADFRVAPRPEARGRSAAGGSAGRRPPNGSDA